MLLEPFRRRVSVAQGEGGEVKCSAAHAHFSKVEVDEGVGWHALRPHAHDTDALGLQPIGSTLYNQRLVRLHLCRVSNHISKHVSLVECMCHIEYTLSRVEDACHV